MSGAFTKKYDDAVKRAVVSAKLDANLTAPEILKRLDAGELVDPESRQKVAPPKDRMPQATVYALVRDEKDRRGGLRGQPIAKPLEAIDQLGERMVRLARQEVDHLTKQRPGRVDLARAKQTTALLRETRALIRGVAPTQGPAGRRTSSTTPDKDGERPKPKSQAEALIADARRSTQAETAPENNRHAREHESAGTSAPPRTPAEQAAAGRAGSLGTHEQLSSH